MQFAQATISEVAQAYGVSLRTLRFYEDRGLLSPVREGTRRFYSARDRVRLELILKGKRLGFTLLEIERLLGAGAGPAGAGSADAGSDTRDGGEPADLRLGKAQVGERLRLLEEKRDSLDSAIRELKQALEARA